MKGALGLVLTGGGARAAYQAGVLRGIAEIHGKPDCPTRVITGISAGAINGALLAAHAHDFQSATKILVDTWGGLRIEEILDTRSRAFVEIGAGVVTDVSMGPITGKTRSNHLIRVDPLRHLLESKLDISRVGKNVRERVIDAFAVTATNYGSGTAVTFFEAPPDTPGWIRSSRMAKAAEITVDHVMASAAIPILFPPVHLEGSYYGDGAIRMRSPVSPAIHLGADRIIGVGVRYARTDKDVVAVNQAVVERLGFADIFGALLNSMFLDNLDSDVERLERINRTVGLLHKAGIPNPDGLKELRMLTIRPSRDLGALASGEFKVFPRTLRFLLGGIGAKGTKGWELLSYLAFHGTYTQALMELGYEDVLRNRAKVEEFLAG